MNETKYTKEQAQFLSKWYKVLFWLVIPGIAANLLTNENIVTEVPALYWPGQILTVLYAVAYGWVLLQLAAENSRYRKAGIWLIVSTIISVFADALSNAGLGAAVISLPIVLVAVGLSIAGAYQEYQGHSEILSDVDAVLSEKWLKLWKWYVIVLVASFAGMLLIFLSAILGVLAMLFAAIAALVVGVLELVYLYRQAKMFESIAGQN